MNHFDGSAARQLDLMDMDEMDGQSDSSVRQPATVRERSRPTMRLLRQDIYAELNRRRRRAQIAARHALGDA
jgi:hypothetical protein